MQESKKVLVADIDWTLITGGNKHHVAAYVIAINAVFEHLSVTQDDINIDARQGMIDNQIILEVLKEKDVPVTEAMRLLPEIRNIILERFLNSYERDLPTAPSDHCLSGAKSLFALAKKCDVPVSVLTGNIEGIAWARLKKMGLADSVLALAGGDLALKRSDLFPFLEMRLIEKLGRTVKKEDLVVLDDAALGIRSAREYGIENIIGVLTGHSTEQELMAAGATFTVPNIVTRCEQIMAFLK